MSTLIIGASGLLGSNLSLKDNALRPSHKTLDITSSKGLATFNYLLDQDVTTVVWLAAYTNVARANIEKQEAHKINVKSLVTFMNFISQRDYRPKLVYISTDYVFNGETGNYKTTDKLDPVKNNYYAYTKAMADHLVSTYCKHLIIRTSFCKSDGWPYESAFIDQFTSRDTVDIIAPKIASIIDRDLYGVYHIGTERKSVYELARRLKPDVKPMSRLNIKDVYLPFDTSLQLTEI